ncbi:hypothetical protein EVAR_51711_1 [Eumeta japonica]|uniref:Uncharacterized protein n=1 Tax=Eumeta variegata TaxID=151549 RepID=A0A4C1XKF1_EUMVA|nr:hypothetical protein EVAR_51711_1 [Eumeta japonica]
MAQSVDFVSVSHFLILFCSVKEKKGKEYYHSSSGLRPERSRCSASRGYSTVPTTGSCRVGNNPRLWGRAERCVRVLSYSRGAFVCSPAALRSVCPAPLPIQISFRLFTTRPEPRRAVVASQYSMNGRALSRLPQWTVNALRISSGSAVTSIFFGILRFRSSPASPDQPNLIADSEMESISIPIGSPQNGPSSLIFAIDEADVIAPPVPKKLQRPPPPFIHDKGRWSEIRKQFESKSIVILNGQNTARGLEIQPAIVPDFRNLSALLATFKVAYHTYSLKEEREFCVVLRGILKELSIEEVKEDLLVQDLQHHKSRSRTTRARISHI